MHYLQVVIIAAIYSVALGRNPFRPKTESGNFCKIPFEKDGKTYHDCTSDGDSKAWCLNASDKKEYCVASADLNNCELAEPKVTFAEVELILKKINDLRRGESALNMGKLTWNTELAKRAQASANQCKLENSYLKLCNSDQGIGQLTFSSSSPISQPRKWTENIDKFFSQKSSYDLDNNKCSAQSCVGYVQLVNAKSLYIGCGANSCNENSLFTDYYYCNFYEPNYMVAPYEKGTNKCDSCYKLDKDASFRCSDSLCEMCDSPGPDCTGRSQLEASGKLCDDADEAFCKLNINVCKFLQYMKKEDRDLMTQKCRKSCKLC